MKTPFRRITLSLLIVLAFGATALAQTKPSAAEIDQAERVYVEAFGKALDAKETALRTDNEYIIKGLQLVLLYGKDGQTSAARNLAERLIGKTDHFEVIANLSHRLIETGDAVQAITLMEKLADYSDGKVAIDLVFPFTDHLEEHGLIDSAYKLLHRVFLWSGTQNPTILFKYNQCAIRAIACDWLLGADLTKLQYLKEGSIEEAYLRNLKGRKCGPFEVDEASLVPIPAPKSK